MKTIATSLILLIAFGAKAQIVSQFTWSSSPLTTAAVGPNATSVSTSATSAYIGGALGYAINPGLPTKNVDLVIPGSPTFDIPAIDIDLYFRREESVASFFKRGSMVSFGMNNGSLTVSFTLTNAGGNISVSSGNIATVADDHAFHHYRFKYDNNSGIANVWVDGVIVYTYTGVAGRPLYYAGAGNVTVGADMDATSRNIPVLANLTIQNPSASNNSLPVNLLSFTANEKNKSNLIQWSTTKEFDLSNFVVERSANGVQFSDLMKVNASGSLNAVRKYSEYDNSPLGGVNYYRLKMIDNDGKFSYSPIVKVVNAGTKVSVSCFPNPAVDQVNLSIVNGEGNYQYTVSTLEGRIVKGAVVNVKAGSQDVNIALGSNVPSGTLIVHLSSAQTGSSQTFKIIKK